MTLPELLIGFGAGVVITAGAAYIGARRSIRRVRAAEQRARAAERMAEIGAMTGGLAHEIKNPLSTIGLNAQLLVEGLQELPIGEDEKSRLVSRTRALQRETERLRGILQDFLEFAGQIHLDRRSTNLNALVSELADFYMPEAERLGVRIKPEFAPGALTAEIDPRLFKQALLNLMINATQAMSGDGVGGGGKGAGIGAGSGGSPDGGTAGASARPRELILRTERGKDTEGRRTASVHVIDSGPGIDKATLKRVFDPYFTTKAGGSGLGLPTARRLIEEHGGHLSATSEPGQGCDFAATVPIGEE